MRGVPLSRIVEIADRLFPFDQAESWDNCGMQIGDPERLIRSMAFSLDATSRTIRFASGHSCDLLVTHHPLLLEPLRRISADTFVGRTIMDAARMGVDILSLHTNLDAADGGLNDDLAGRIGLREVMTPQSAPCARVGLLHHPLPVSELAGKIAAELGISHVRIVSKDDREVRRVFCASGSGMGYFQEAIRQRADVIVTGDVRYHGAREAMEMGIPVIDPGHYGLERSAVSLLASAFRKEWEKLGLDIQCIECNSEKEPFTALSQSSGGF